MAERTTHVRVREGTLSALQQLRDEMAESVRRGRGRRFWGDGPLTLADLVEELVSRELAHRERSRRAGKKKPQDLREVLTLPAGPAAAVELLDGEGDAQDLRVTAAEDWFKKFEREMKAGG